MRYGRRLKRKLGLAPGFTPRSFGAVPALVSAITGEVDCSAHHPFLCRTETLPSTKSYPSNLGSYHWQRVYCDPETWLGYTLSSVLLTRNLKLEWEVEWPVWMAGWDADLVPPDTCVDAHCVPQKQWARAVGVQDFVPFLLAADPKESRVQKPQRMQWQDHL